MYIWAAIRIALLGVIKAPHIFFFRIQICILKSFYRKALSRRPMNILMSLWFLFTFCYLLFIYYLVIYLFIALFLFIIIFFFFIQGSKRIRMYFHSLLVEISDAKVCADFSFYKLNYSFNIVYVLD